MSADTRKISMTDRSRNLLDNFFHLGIWLSYDHVLEITRNICENLCLSKKVIFSVLLKNNIDVNNR